MNLIIPKILKTIPYWNKRKLTESDFFRICENLKIEVNERRMKIRAVSWYVLNENVIIVNTDLSPKEKLFAMWHELAHIILHNPEKRVLAYL